MARAIGIRYELRDVRIVVEKGDDTTPTKWRSDVEAYTNGLRLLDAIATFLDATRAVVFIDGVDEADLDTRGLLQRQISDLAHRLQIGKVVATCRSGAYQSQFEPLDVVELCPLDASQVRSIASKWLSDGEDFLRQLQALPYKDVADRPLLLIQLLLLYRRYGELPEQPSDVYRRIIGLAIAEWDADQNIRRLSKYAHFQPDRKVDFLAAVSFHLTYLRKAKSFRHEDLVETYDALHRQFRLPPHAAVEVARELESHTGLIVDLGDLYEFSHLSLQEYLCAHQMIRQPLASSFRKYFHDYPEPLAIATALASAPGAWFAALVFSNVVQSAVFPGRAQSTSSLARYLSRLFLEKPAWGVSSAFGAALMSLYRASASSGDPALALLDQLAHEADALDSLAAAWSLYATCGERTLDGRRYIIYRSTSEEPALLGYRLSPEAWLPFELHLRLIRPRSSPA